MATSLKERIIDPDDQAFIETFMSDNNQEVYWQGWVLLYTKANAAAKKERILVVTNFRVFTVKHGVLKRSTRQSFPILDLEELSASPGPSTDSIHLVFAGQELDIQGEQVVDIAQAILFAYKSITYGRDKTPRIELPQRFFDGFTPPEPDTQDGLLASYCAACDYLGIAQKLPVLDYFMTAFETQDKVLDVGDALGPVEKVTVSDLQTLSACLRYTHWFEEIIAVDYPIKDEGLTALSQVLATPGSIVQRLILVNIKAKAGFSALAQHLAAGHHSLKYLNISKNSLGDSGVKTVLEGLKRPLERLCLQACGFSSKGFRDLVAVINTPGWRSTLKVLDVSDNSAGKAGTQALAEFIRESTGLEQLYAMRADLTVELLFEALAANTVLAHTVLQTINLSGNKMGKAMPALAAILLQSKSLTHLYLVDCALTRQAVVELLEAAISNPHGARYWLELSNNDLGPKGAKDLADLFLKKKHIDTVHTLILNSNALAAEGVIAICQSLSGTNIHTLSLDSNIKTGMFASNTKEAGEAIAQFMLSTPALKELSLSGDDNHYLKAAAHPVLAALRTNSSLEYLDVSRNRLGDEGLKILADSLAVNKSLTSFTAERNRVGIKGLRDLHAAVMTNTTLTDWAIPMTDIENIHNSASVKVVRELRQLVFDFEAAMERNLEATQKRQVQVAAASAPAQPQVAADSKVNDSFLTVPGSGARRASLHYDDAGRRGSTRPVAHRQKKRHSRNASDMFAHFSKDVGDAVDDGSKPVDGDGDVDADADEPSVAPQEATDAPTPAEPAAPSE